MGPTRGRATQSGRGCPDTDDLTRVLPKQRPLISKSDLAATPTKDTDISLGVLVRQWLTTSEEIDRRALPAGDGSALPAKWTPPQEDPLVSGGNVVPVVTPSPDRAQAQTQSQEKLISPPRATAALTDRSRPALPRRRRQPVARPHHRLAVLIDAEATPVEQADALFDVLAEQGTVSVCRAYADWTSPKARAWWTAPLRRHGIQPNHQFGQITDQRTLVALTIDAVDLARESAVDTVAIVGDLASLHPLVARLNASGLQVFGFGTTPTPRDVRELCHEFVDLSEDPDNDGTGRHRA